MKIIGLTGAAGSGKDTVAGFALEWCRENDLNATRVAFADPLKQSAAACFGILPHAALDFCNWLKQPGVFVNAERVEGEGDIPTSATEGSSGIVGKRVSGRQFLQFYGAEAHRDVFSTSFWSDVLEADLERKEKEGIDVVFITDVRFENEGRLIYELGDIWAVARALDTTVEAHASEEPLRPELITLTIDNDGSLEDLRTLVCSICEDNLEEVA